MSPMRYLALGVLLVLGASQIPASAYVLSSSYKWATPPVWRVNPANFSGLSPEMVEAAVRSGPTQWAQAGSTFTFTWGGRVTDTVTAVDGRNVVIFRNVLKPDNSSALASTYSWWKNGVRYDSDITFWMKPFFTGTSGCASGWYIEDVATHEIGHTLGIGHSPLAAATMYYSASRCEQVKRTLAADDIAAVRAQYP